MSNRRPVRHFGERPQADKPADVDEDDDISLPPLDADEETEGSAEDEDDLDDIAHEDGADPLDDADASDLDIGSEIDETEEDEPNAEAADGGIDVGALDDEISAREEDERAAERDEESGTTIDDDGVDDLDTDATRDDGGAEGTGENAENDVDESALPELDESEHDEADETLADILLEEAETLPPWAATRFVLLDRVSEWTPFDAAASPAESEALPAETGDGLCKARVESGGSVFSLVVKGRSASLSIVASDGARTVKLDPELEPKIVQGESPRLLTSPDGKRVAILADGALAVSHNVGASFEAIDLHHVLAACFATGGDIAPLYALLVSKASGSVFLVRISEDGEPNRLVELSPLRGVSDLGAISLVWDEERKLIWARSKHGNFAFGPAVS